jgi:hypothetical protein
VCFIPRFYYTKIALKLSKSDVKYFNHRFQSLNREFKAILKTWWYKQGQTVRIAVILFSLLYKINFFIKENSTMNAIAPPLHRGMLELERSAFKKVIQPLAIKVPSKKVGLVMKSMSK